MRATRYDRYRRAQNADHFAHNSPFSAFFAEVVCTLGMTPPRTAISPPPKGVCTTSMESTARPAGPGCGTRGLRCPWAAARPGRASRRRTQPHTATQAPPVRRAPEGTEGTGELRADAPIRICHRAPLGREAGYPGGGTHAVGPGRASHSDTSAAGVEGAGGHGGPGRASRSTTPSRRLACGDLAGGRARRHPEHQRHHKQDHQPSSPPPTGTPSSPAPAHTLRRMPTRHSGITKPPGPIGAGRQWR